MWAVRPSNVPCYHVVMKCPPHPNGPRDLKPIDVGRVSEIAELVGAAVTAIGRADFFSHLTQGLSKVIGFSNTDLVIVDLGDELDAAPVLVGLDSSDDRYPAAIRGRYIPYAFRRCPEIALLRGGLPAGIYSMADLGTSRFLGPPSYEDYFRWLGVSNFYDLFGDLGDGRIAGWSIGRHLGEEGFTTEDDRVLRAFAPLLISLIARHCQMAFPLRHRDPTTFSGPAGERLRAIVDRMSGKKLSERERQVALLMAQGLSTKQTARRLDIAPMTEAVHRRNIFRKLNIGSQTELVSRCLEIGLSMAL
jgi:DNA-binding CsgD family transcriptional regulator